MAQEEIKKEDEAKVDSEEELKEETEAKSNKKEKKITKEDKLKEEIARLEKALKDEKEKNLREIAEMQTTKRRLKEAEINNRKYAAMPIIEELIAPIDMLLAVVNSEAPSEEIKNYQLGFQMIANQLLGILEHDGLKAIPCEVDMEFDPKHMQALTTEEVEGIENAKVIKVLQKGYMYKDRVLKPVMVNVAIPKKVENKEEIKEEKGE